MNKPLTMMIKETKTKIANICNESGLPPVILDLIMQGIYSEIRFLADKQISEEEKSYMETIKESANSEDNKINEG